MLLRASLCPLGLERRLLSSLLAGLVGRTRLLREFALVAGQQMAWAELPPASMLMTSRLESSVLLPWSSRSTQPLPSDTQTERF